MPKPRYFDDEYAVNDCNLCEEYYMSRCDGKATKCNSFKPVNAATIAYYLKAITGGMALTFLMSLITLLIVILK